MENIGLLRCVRNRTNANLYKLPHATYAGRCDREIDDMVTDIKVAIRQSVPHHHSEIAIGACGLIRIGGLEVASLTQAAEIIMGAIDIFELLDSSMDGFIDHVHGASASSPKA